MIIKLKIIQILILVMILKMQILQQLYLKVQERKTAKGNSYAVLKLTDLTSVFELFIFSDILELNREILKKVTH